MACAEATPAVRHPATQDGFRPIALSHNTLLSVNRFDYVDMMSADCVWSPRLIQ